SIIGSISCFLPAIGASRARLPHHAVALRALQVRTILLPSPRFGEAAPHPRRLLRLCDGAGEILRRLFLRGNRFQLLSTSKTRNGRTLAGGRAERIPVHHESVAGHYPSRVLPDLQTHAHRLPRP